jgi:hypothetical protein
MKGEWLVDRGKELKHRIAPHRWDWAARCESLRRQLEDDRCQIEVHKQAKKQVKLELEARRKEVKRLMLRSREIASAQRCLICQPRLVVLFRQNDRNSIMNRAKVQSGHITRMGWSLARFNSG